MSTRLRHVAYALVLVGCGLVAAAAIFARAVDEMTTFPAVRR